MFDFILTTPISFFVATAALTGVTVHDTKIDKLATTVASAHIANADAALKFSTDPHTHVEKVSLEGRSQARIMPRDNQKKHLMQKNMPKGAHAFDGYALPIV